MTIPLSTSRRRLLNPRHDPQKFRDQIDILLSELRAAERRLRQLKDIDLQNHLEDFTNPHQVTYDQVGAAPQSIEDRVEFNEVVLWLTM